jgi:hypothetical protein
MPRVLELKGDRLFNMTEESSRPSIQAVTRILPAAFSLVYGENLEEKAQQKGLNNLQFCQKEACVKLGPRNVCQ